MPTVTLSPEENSLVSDAMASDAGIAIALMPIMSIDFIMKFPTGLIRYSTFPHPTGVYLALNEAVLDTG
ncbi:hypothetical protein JCM14467A_19590 [Vulcanisaeta sp. JCM 14467]